MESLTPNGEHRSSAALLKGSIVLMAPLLTAESYGTLDAAALVLHNV